MRGPTVTTSRGAVAAVVLAALVLWAAGGVAARAGPTSKRYTVTAAYDGSYEEHWSRTYAASSGGWDWEWNDWVESASYVGRSTSPFTIRRSADRRSFAFDAKLKINASAVGNGLHRYHGIRPETMSPDPQTCLQTRAVSSASGRGMSGIVRMRPGDTKIAAGPMLDDPDFATYTLDELCTPSGWGWSNRWTSSWVETSPGWMVSAAQLRKHFGRAFTVTSEYNYDTGVDGTVAPNRNRMVLRFTPVGGQKDEDQKTERWQVEVTGIDRWSWGMYTTLGAGIWVKWAHRTSLEIKDDKIVKATGRVRILRVTPFSDVKDAFLVTNVRTTTPGPYAIPKASLGKNRVRLGVLKDGWSQYRADFTVQAGPRLLEALRNLGVPDPQTRYDAMVARGGVPNTAVPLVPNDPQINVKLQRGTYPRNTDAFNQQLPCTQFKGSDPDCRLMRGAEIVDVTGG